MKRMIFFIALAFLLSASIVLLPVQVYAQRHVTVLNPSFEKPDSGKVTGFDGKSIKPGVKLLDIPYWNVDALDSLQWDSGVETATSVDGKYVAFLMGGDPGIYQILSRRVYDDDMIKLTVDAKISWLGTTLKMELFYLDGDSATAPRVSIVSETKTLTSTVTEYSISFNGYGHAAVGYKLGILFDNVSDSASWIHIDNVRLTNEDPTIIEVPNFSFELPDSGKIKGWNGPGSSPNIADSQADIPGWTTDTVTVNDSGVELGWDPQDGIYTGFMMGSDTSVWNTTDYTILAGDVITLRVMGRVTWAAELLHSELYYVDGLGQRVTLEYSDDVLNTDYSYAEYSVGFAADATPECIGKKLGVLLDNVSPTGSSWLGVDLVRINANHDVVPVSVSGTQMKPTVFSLAQNYPNPFNPSTQFSYTVGKESFVSINIYDMLGREVATLVNEVKQAGTYPVTWNAARLGSGVYFYKIQAGSFSETKKMLLIK